MSNFYPQQFGGYPQGYPPSNPFVPPYQANTPFIPGVTTPMEITDRNGNTTVISPNTYVPGGVRSNPGGFNPVTRTITQPSATQGFNPFGNTGPFTPVQNITNGFAPFSPPDNSYPPQPPRPQYGIGGYGYNTSAMYGYPQAPYRMMWQNSFDQEIQDILYNEEPSSPITVREIISGILGENELESSNRGYIVGYDYYGNPIYSNPGSMYQDNLKRQEAFEEARGIIQKHFTMLSRIAHAYSGETINEQEMMERFDPVSKPTNNNVKVFNYFSATKEEKEEYAENMRLQDAKNISVMFDAYEAAQTNMRYELFNRIKQSHDALIGVQPGEHYSLKQYMDNGYKLNMNIALQKARHVMRNGQLKYSSTDFRNVLSKTRMAHNMSPIPTTKDDDYVSIEERIKSVYDRNKSSMGSFMADQQSRYQSLVTETSGPVEPMKFDSEREAHAFFMNYVQKKKERNEAMKNTRY